jgi:hypothetical protein
MSLMCESFTKVSPAGDVEAPPVAPTFASHLVFVTLCEAPIVGRCSIPYSFDERKRHSNTIRVMSCQLPSLVAS